MQCEISHSDISRFCTDRVNLPGDAAQEYRDQVNRLRERLEAHIAENPSFALVKMLHAGSLAKGTALRTINDLDVAVYVEKDAAPSADESLVPWLADRLREANPNMKPEQFEVRAHCVTVRLRGSGLDVDVVPVLYEGADNDIGYLVDKNTGDRLLTSIPRHLEFVRTRKRTHPDHFAQIVRLMKWWAAQRKAEGSAFKCKSFMLELLIADWADRDRDLSDYPCAMEALFSEIVKTGLEKRIAFTDFYPATRLPGPTGAAIEIFDPVNPANNVASRYTVSDRNALVQAAETAADAISEAHYATTKARAVECWQIVLGPGFRG